MGADPPQLTSRVPWFVPAVANLGAAVVYTLAYSDVFDYPLEEGEVWRYLIGLPASRAEVRRTLGILPEVETDGTYFYLAGRQAITEVRETRAEIATRMWPRVQRYAARIARLPFVRMVALTGALAVVNAPADDDFDFLIVTEPGYLWLTRALVIALVVHPSTLKGDEVCPNYLITTDSLFFSTRDLFTAHELAQMVPFSGRVWYEQLRQRNAWVYDFLPNSQGPPGVLGSVSASARRTLSQRLAEPLLRTGLGTRLEHWEMTRKIPKLTPDLPGSEVLLGPDQCKGHVSAHQAWVHEGFVDRLTRFGPD